MMWAKMLRELCDRLGYCAADDGALFRHLRYCLKGITRSLEKLEFLLMLL